MIVGAGDLGRKSGPRHSTGRGDPRRWSVALASWAEAAPDHHVAEGFEWLPIFGLAVLALAVISVFAGDSRKTSGRDRPEGD